MKTIDRTDLERWTREERPFALIDVLPDDPNPQAVGTPPHARSQAEIMGQITRLLKHKEQPVVLYEAASASVRFSAAAAMLEQAGFASVFRFAGPQAALHASEHGAPSLG